MADSARGTGTLTAAIIAETAALTWQSYDLRTHELVTRAVPIPALSQPSLLSELLTGFGEIPGIRNPRIDTTRTVELGDIPTPRFGWVESDRDDVPMFPDGYAAIAVICPKCKSRGGTGCQSTGGGNGGSVATHKARFARIAGWTNAVQEHARMLVKEVGHYGYGNAGLFAVFEQVAAPIPAKGTKQPTPKGVRLSEKQAEEIERFVHCGGTGFVSTAHFSGDHQDRQTVNALEAKGIVEFVKRTDDGYDRIMRLTPFGWQVYRQHRLIIRRLTDAEVDALEAKAQEAS